VRSVRAGEPQASPTGSEGDPGPGRGPGVLFLVSTPIGNLEDITLRALRCLREVDWIAAEDTRHTAILLRENGITRPMISCHAHNEHQRTPQLVSRLLDGENGALVTDAGTPGISDPGFLLARAARAAGVRVEVIPGSSAVLMALLASGLPCERFCFLGYAPAKGAVRTRFLTDALSAGRTTVLFESPHRIHRMLDEIAAAAPDREIAVCRELTKKFEEILRGRADDLARELAGRTLRGEITVVIGHRREGEHA
jgi:16S rRNA (cytidine1402-2'-O)-methyltransferase